MYSKPSNSVWSMASSVVLRERGREGREGGRAGEREEMISGGQRIRP